MYRQLKQAACAWRDAYRRLRRVWPHDVGLSQTHPAWLRERPPVPNGVRLTYDSTATMRRGARPWGCPARMMPGPKLFSGRASALRG